MPTTRLGSDSGLHFQGHALRGMILENIALGQRYATDGRDDRLPASLRTTVQCARGWAIHAAALHYTRTQQAADSLLRPGIALDSVATDSRDREQVLRTADSLLHERFADLVREVKQARDGTARDSYWFPEELTGRRPTEVVRPRARSALVEGIPVRAEDPGAEVWLEATADFSGAIKSYRQGDTQPPVIGNEVAERRYAMHAWWTSTVDYLMAAERARYAGRDPRQLDAQGVQALFVEHADSLLVSGQPGLDFRSFAHIPAPRYASQIDYSDPSVTIAARWADMLAFAEVPRQSSADAVDRGSVLYISPELLFRLAGSTNLNAGGSEDAEGYVLRRFASRGIRRVVEVPRFRGAGGANIDLAMIAQDDGDPYPLRQVVGMRPAPVRTVLSPGGDQTVYAMIHGGLSLPVAEGAVIGSFKVG